MTRVMRAISRRLEVPSSDARLLQMTNNALFALPSAGLVVRISRSITLNARTEKIVALARWFATVDGPAIRLAGALPQPIVEGDLYATVWRYVPAGPGSTLEELGPAIRALHELPCPTFELPRWDPIGDARARLADAEGLDADDAEALHEWCRRLEPSIKELRERRDRTLLHGDAHLGNLLREPSGRVVWCDFDAVSIGPAPVDLVSVPVGEARFRRSGVHRRLARSYGYDITTDSDWELFRAARELKMVVAAVPRLASGPGVAKEFKLRLRSIVDGDHTVRWTPFANL